MGLMDRDYMRPGFGGARRAGLLARLGFLLWRLGRACRSLLRRRP